MIIIFCENHWKAKDLLSFIRRFHMSSRKKKAQNLSRGYTNKGTSFSCFSFLKESDSGGSLFSDRVSKAECNIQFVETSDSFAKLATKKLDLVKWPKILGLKLFKIKTVQNKEKKKKKNSLDLIGRLYEFLYFITYFFTILCVGVYL